MNILTMEELKELTSLQKGHCISIYMPTVEKGQETRQNPIRFKNLIDQAFDLLKTAGMESSEIRRFFQPLDRLLNDGSFWQTRDSGLAVFLSANTFQTFSLPVDVEAEVVVNDRFYIKPMLPLLHGPDQFYILALSQGHVKLLRATENEVEELNVPNLPKNMADALGYEELDKSFQWRTTTQLENTGGTGKFGSNRTDMFHGHTEDDDNRKEYIVNYFRQVDKAVSSYLNKENKSPLVLASVEYLKPLYKEANTYENLSDEMVPGNPEGTRNEKLRDEAWKLLKPQFETTKENITGQYKLLAGWKDPRAAKDIDEIVKAAPYGRVEVLFIDKNAKRWGTFDENNIEVHFDQEQRPGNEDLLDFAAVQTLLHGGTVYALEPEDLPEGGSPAAAILRY